MSIAGSLRLQRENFSLSVEFSENTAKTIVLFGDSGSGKTTFLRAIAGLESSCSGFLTVSGEQWLSSTINKPIHQRRVALVFQGGHLFSHLNVNENLEYALKRAVKDNPLQKEDVVKNLGLSDLLDHKTSLLSGGERQRVALARCLLSHPKLLLLDEPLSALDYRSKAHIVRYLKTIFPLLNIPVIYVTHSPQELASLAHSVWVMSKGEITHSGTISQLMTDSALPFSHKGRRFSVVQGQATHYDDAHSLLSVDIGGQSLFVVSDQAVVGSALSMHVFADDVSVCLEKPVQTSIVNILKATIANITNEKNEHCVQLKLQCASNLIVANISRYSFDYLQLTNDQEVYVQIKSVVLSSL